MLRVRLCNIDHIPVDVVSRYRYKFIVDGVWLTDPSAAIEQDDQGFQNNILDVHTAQVSWFFSVPVICNKNKTSNF
jgi:Glycogen recognition site of AMP-activated protein kinase